MLGLTTPSPGHSLAAGAAGLALHRSTRHQPGEHMQFDDKTPPRSGRGFLIPLLIVVAVVLMVVLHLAGVVGPGSH
jgi:hypothetical protein